MKQGRILTAILAGVLLGTWACAWAQETTFSGYRDGQPNGAVKHYVFAHYMVCFAAYGESVADYKREIRVAQAAGIDGFALNCGAWHNEPHYPRRTKAIYQAAQELGNGFKLFFSVDFAGLKRHPPGEFESYVLDMVKTYGHHPKQFMVDGRTVVSTFAGGQGIAWTKDILAPLKAAGYNVFLVPFFYPRPRVTELPDEQTVREHYRKWADVVDGMFYFGAAGTAQQLAASNAAYAKVLREAGKVCMCSYSYVTTMMTAPAELHVTSGGTKTVHPLKAGMHHLRIPFSCGSQHFAVYGDGKSILSKDGEPIVDRIERYDFFPASGFAYGN